MPQVQRMGSSTCSGSPADRGGTTGACRQTMQSGPYIIGRDSTGSAGMDSHGREYIPFWSADSGNLCRDRTASCTVSCIILCHILVCEDRLWCGSGKSVSGEFTLSMGSRQERGHSKPPPHRLFAQAFTERRIPETLL